MRIRLSRLLLSALALVILALLLGPLLITTTPFPGLATAHSLATPDSHFLTIPFPGTLGIEIHYLAGANPVQTGAKTGFLLLHGFTFNAFTWNQQISNFNQHGRVVAYDQTPYGLSAKLTADQWQGENPYSKPAAVQQLFAVLDSLGLDRAVLVGNSSGGTLAIEAALARPERVLGLILVAPWVLVNRPTISEQITALPQLHRISLFIARQLGERGLISHCYADLNQITPERLALTTIHNRVQNWDLAWGELLNRSLSSPVTIQAYLQDIHIPALLISGDQDRLVPLTATQQVAKILPEAELAVLPGCGHVPQEECAEAFAQAVNSWLAVHPKLMGNNPTP